MGLMAKGKIRKARARSLESQQLQPKLPQALLLGVVDSLMQESMLSTWVSCHPLLLLQLLLQQLLPKQRQATRLSWHLLGLWLDISQ